MQFHNQLVLIMGGTKGLGLAIGVEFARLGAQVCLAYKWGSANEKELYQQFSNCLTPKLIAADAGDHEAIENMMKQLYSESYKKIDIIIHCVAFAKIIKQLNDIKKNSLDISLKYSSFAFIDLLQTARSVFNCYPRYAIAISSEGVDVCYPGYDLVGCSKAVLETLCRYLATRLKNENVIVNAIRPGLMDTDSVRKTFGDEFIEKIKINKSDAFMDPKGVAKTCVALCSGWMDAMTGQVLTVDEGFSLQSPLNYLLEENMTL